MKAQLTIVLPARFNEDEFRDETPGAIKKKKKTVRPFRALTRVETLVPDAQIRSNTSDDRFKGVG